MKLVTASECNEYVQNPGIYFTDPEIQCRTVVTDKLGVPKGYRGNFAFTYQFTGGGGDVALRCFHNEIPELFERYRAISAFLRKLNSAFFVDFAFLEQGLRVAGEMLPTVRMEWVRGELLLTYV